MFPLAMPLIAGLGSLTTVLLYTVGDDVLAVVAVLGGLLVVLAVQFVLDAIKQSLVLG